MIEKIKALCVKHREILVYLTVGVLNVVENLSGILFAYYPNRRWVFQSKNPKILPEFAGFFSSRLGTWGLSYGLNLLLCNVLKMDYRLATVLVSIVVVIGNYVISKFLIFHKQKDGEGE